MATVQTAINYYDTLVANSKVDFSKADQVLEQAARDSDMQSNDDYNLICAMAAIVCARGVATAQQAQKFLIQAAAFVKKIHDKNANKEKANKLIEHESKLLEAMTKTLWERLLGFLLGFISGAVFTVGLICAVFLLVSAILPAPHMTAIGTFLQAILNPLVFWTAIAGAAVIALSSGVNGSRIGAGGLWENIKYAISNFFRSPENSINSRMDEIREMGENPRVAPLEMTNADTWKRLRTAPAPEPSNILNTNVSSSITAASSVASSAPNVVNSASVSSSDTEHLLEGLSASSTTNSM